MEWPKIIVLATVLRRLERVRNHFLSCSNKLERYCMCQKQLNWYWKSERYQFAMMSHNTGNTESLLQLSLWRLPRVKLQSKWSLQAVNDSPSWPTDSPWRLPRVKLQSKWSLQAVNRGPSWLTDSLWPLLYAALITTIPLLVIYQENSVAYSDSRRRNECQRRLHSFQVDWRFPAT